MIETRQSWSLIIFCYNEAQNLPQVLDKAIQNLESISLPDYEIIIVDDGSTDNTNAVVQHYLNLNNKIRLISLPENRGIGSALKTGYDAATKEVVCAIPGDGQFSTDELLPFTCPENNTFISFYRVENLHYSVFRNILSLFNKKLNEWFMGIRLKDVNWVKIYRRADLKQLQLRNNSSLIESEICSKLIIRGVEVKEVESKYMKRQHGESKGASPKIVWQAVREMTKLISEIYRYRNTLLTQHENQPGAHHQPILKREKPL